MNLDLSPDEQRFQAEVRRFFAEDYPAAILAKMRGGQRLTRDDQVAAQQALQARGWLAAGWLSAGRNLDGERRLLTPGDPNAELAERPQQPVLAVHDLAHSWTVREVEDPRGALDRGRSRRELAANIAGLQRD